METTRTQVSIAPALPRKKDLKNDLVHFGLLNILVVGMVALMFAGRTTVSELRPSSTPASGATVTTSSYTHPGYYGRTPR